MNKGTKIHMKAKGEKNTREIKILCILIEI